MVALPLNNRIKEIPTNCNYLVL